MPVVSRIKFLFIALFTLIVAGEPLAAESLQDGYYRECMQKYEAVKERRTETECYTYGNKMECTSKPKLGGYDPYMAQKTKECLNEAEAKLRQSMDWSFSQSNGLISEAISSAHSVPLLTRRAWGNPATDLFGHITPIRDGTTANGKKCREYEILVHYYGGTETLYKTACLEPNGRWLIIN